MVRVMNIIHNCRVIDSLEEFRQQISELKQQKKTIGLVPTMGALHKGHLSLVQKSLARCDATIVTIFVNPTQFAPTEDFAKYPRTLEHDLKLLGDLGPVIVFVPSTEVMYPEEFDTFVEVGGVARRLEGESRPTHFRGVATVVLKLFMMSGADVAYFGQKDFQQTRVIQKMVADLNLPIEIHVCPIIRESDGLAMSSRNRYLSSDERKQALVLSQSLAKAEELIRQGEKNAKTVREAMKNILFTVPSAKIDYIAVVDPETLEELSEIDRAVAILLAVTIGTTRLIDNVIVP